MWVIYNVCCENFKYTEINGIKNYDFPSFASQKLPSVCLIIYILLCFLTKCEYVKGFALLYKWDYIKISSAYF